MRAVSLSTIAFVCAWADVDCSAYVPWTPSTSGNPPMGNTWKVYYDGFAYESTTWVDVSNIPGDDSLGWSPWTKIGQCEAGTMGDGMSNAPGTEDCSEIYAWDPRAIYAQEGQQVHSEGGLYKSKYWNEGEKPSLTSEPWAYVGKCLTGTDTKGPENPTPLPPQWMLDLTCSCCDNCGTIVNGQVYCKDVAEEKCYYKWCGNAHQKDDAACTDAKNHQKFAWWNGEMPASKPSWPKQVYAPYFDSGLYGWPPLTELAQNYGVDHYVVAFVVSTSEPSLKTGGCNGAFAGAISIEAGPTYEKDGKFSYLYDELKKLREMGGDFVISFGGANGTELADSAECQTGDAVANLVAEYGRILDYTNSTRIDFDIEGLAYSGVQANTGWKYRFEAVKQLKQARPNLHVTWTLPILPTGLTLDGVNFFGQMMDQDAPFDIINVMNMDYGECPTICDNARIDQCERDAIDNLVEQLFDLASTRNKASQYLWHSKEDVYAFVGSTPMLGKNDVTCLTYTLEAAKTNLAHWQEKKIGMLSNWSVARDHPCPSSQSVSVDCSSYDGQTKDYEFLQAFAAYTKA
ncbi:putative chitinase/lysozyme protein [Gregarina niphandrodes]|uniref:Chitinase/lysozyme protein n=1 Tax=Gregarina niphandrodes TaxID=110365 RepID=A0A023B7V8_GRENI|nr:putative chitinase/lysozyme protein [Gregarina niphandrodes]EZG67979.1 putative chitinase/lysozyme protein [Gregarina niphandrodes]|eukprot:XP_011130128.1 putative chitinase/lysozyme protein [Gregarina niphandrodes]